jgi:hypothetical protein
MAKDKSRTIYAHETLFYRYDADAETNEVEAGWKSKTSSKVICDVFEHIMTLPEEKRTLRDVNLDWIMYLNDVKFLKKNFDNPEACIKGYFYSTTDGLRTSLIDINTLAKEQNQKKPGQNELRKTHFYIRMSDGLFLLDSYSSNVATNSRIETYILHFAKDILTKNKIIRLSFEKLLSQGFIDKLNNFEVINLAQLRVKIGPELKYDKTDAMGHMQDDAKVVRASQVDITLSYPRTRKEGMLPVPLANLLKKYMNRDGIIAGTIKGKPLPGNQPILKFKGAEEKYSKRFEVDAEGEVLTEVIFEHMLKLSIDREMLLKL